MKPNEPSERAEQPEATSLEDRGAAVARIFREHNRKLVGLLVTRLKNEQEAKEVAQEAYVKVLQLEPDRGAVSYLRSYLFKVAENLAIDRLRQRQTRAQLDRLDSIDDFFEEPRAERAAIAQQQLQLLRRFVAELPPTCADVFRLHKLADRPIAEVAATLGLQERMVRRHLRRAVVYICLRCEGHSVADSWKVLS